MFIEEHISKTHTSVVSLSPREKVQGINAKRHKLIFNLSRGSDTFQIDMPILVGAYRKQISQKIVKMVI